MSDLETLLRETLHERAATVTRGPAWVRQPPTRHRTRVWAPLLAAAVVVAVVGVAAAVTRSDDPSTPAGGPGDATCEVGLPSSWDNAVSAETIGGADTTPVAGGPDGAVITETVTRSAQSLMLLHSDGSTRTLLTESGSARLVSQPDWDGADLVVPSTSRLPVSGPDRRVDDLRVVDTGTGTRSGNILTRAPMPEGWVFAGKRAVVQDGVVYWGARPSAEDDTHGVVVAYRIRDNSYRVVARTTTFPDVERDRRGVVWPGGGVPRSGVPAGVPPYFANGDTITTVLRSDGTHYAWQDLDGRTITSSDADGHTSAYFVPPTRARSQPPTVDAVAGSFVFLGINETDGSHNWVLDTRTGALAPTSPGDAYLSFDNGSLFVHSGQRGAWHRVEVATLPALHC